MAFIDSYSAWTMFRPVSPERTLMKKDCLVPSGSSMSIRPVFAQKLTPCPSVDATVQPFGSPSARTQCQLGRITSVSNVQTYVL
jgi:hypothetical protein